MNMNNLTPILSLTIAYLFSEYAFKNIEEVISVKRFKSIWLYFHSAFSGLLSYVLVGYWSAYWLPIIIILAHVIGDGLATKSDNTISTFLSKFIFHFIIIGLSWYLLVKLQIDFLIDILRQITSPKILVVIIIYLFNVWPVGTLIAKLTDKWRTEIGSDSVGLKNAGLWIGRLERTLILTFVLLNQFGSIGFLIAAKSIFRISEISAGKSRQLAEYFLIGTMISFTISILSGVVLLQVLESIP